MNYSSLYRDILSAGGWPKNTRYISCDDFDGTNTPERNVDLRSAFGAVTEPTTYGSFVLNNEPNATFNGHSYMKFDMTVSSLSIRMGVSENAKELGTWLAGLNNPLNIQTSEEVRNLTADIVYRIYTVEVYFNSYI